MLVVRWKNGLFLVNLVLRHIQCFIAFSYVLGSIKYKLAACQVGILGEIFLWAEI